MTAKQRVPESDKNTDAIHTGNSEKNLGTEIERLEEVIREKDRKLAEQEQLIRASRKALEQKVEEQAQIQNQLREANKRLNMIVDSVPDIIYRLDRDGNITFISEAIRNYGYDPEALKGTNIFDIIYEEDLDRAKYRINERRTGDRKTHFLELRFRRKNTPQIPFDVMSKWSDAQPTFLISAEGMYSSDHPEADNFQGTLGIARDITDRKLAAVELFQVMDHLRAVLDAMPGFVSWVSRDLKYIGVNKMLAESFGKTPEFFIGKDVGFQKSHQGFSQFTREFMMSSRQFETRETQITIKNQTYDYLIVAQKYLRNQAAVFIGLDISMRKQYERELARHKETLELKLEERVTELRRTNQRLEKEKVERKRAEKELLKTQKLESIGLLARGIAHDFNNLLTAMLGNISIALLLSKTDKKLQHRLRIAEKACLQAQDLTNNLLAFAQTEGTIRQTVDAARIVRQSVGFSLSGSEFKCEYNIAEGLRPVEVHIGQLNQALNNIILNAMEAMPDGGNISISIDNITLTSDSIIPPIRGDFVKITITDYGYGIAPEDVDRIFDPYFTTKDTHSGLGLTTAYAILKQHNGYITVESKPGRGTTFTIYLPAVSEPSGEPGADAPPAESLKSLQGKGRILVMDDEQLISLTVKLILEEFGFEVFVTDDGAEAIKMYRSAMKKGEPIDAVILDMTIPGGMGGKKTLLELKKIDPDIKALASSGYTPDLTKYNWKEMGFTGFIAKPYKAEDIINKLVQILSDSVH